MGSIQMLAKAVWRTQPSHIFICQSSVLKREPEHWHTDFSMQAYIAEVVTRPIFTSAIFPVHCQWFWWLSDWQPAAFCVWQTLSRCPSNTKLLPPISLFLSLSLSICLCFFPPCLSLTYAETTETRAHTRI